MRSATAVTLAVALVSNCGPATPADETLDRIEALLVQSPCVGALDRWSRHYEFERRDDGIAPGAVEIILLEAGHRGMAAGRYTRSDVFGTLDDSPIRVAFGHYDLASGRISGWLCGSNYSGGAPGAFPEEARRSD